MCPLNDYCSCPEDDEAERQSDTACAEDGIEIYDAVLPAMVTPPVAPCPNRWSDGPSLVELDAYGDFAPERSGHDG